jgi:hypothetical protein
VTRTVSAEPSHCPAASDSTCSIRSVGQAATTRCFQAASSRAGPKPSSSVSCAEARAAGAYSSVTYSITIRSACTFGPSERRVCLIRSTQPSGMPSASWS